VFVAVLLMDSTFSRVGDRLLRVFSGAEAEGSAVDVPGAEVEGSAVDGRPAASASGDSSFGDDQVVCSPASVSHDPVPSVPYVSDTVPSFSHASDLAPPFDASPMPALLLEFWVPDPVALGTLQRPDIVFVDDGDDDDDEEEEKEKEWEEERGDCARMGEEEEQWRNQSPTETRAADQLNTNHD